MTPNQPKTPVRTVRLTDDQVEAITAGARSFSEAIRKFADQAVTNLRAFDDLTAATDTFRSDAHEAATLAAFPGLPECMTLDEARRRAGAAVDAARPFIERDFAERIDDACQRDLETMTESKGRKVLVVPWRTVKDAMQVTDGS